MYVDLFSIVEVMLYDKRGFFERYARRKNEYSPSSFSLTVLILSGQSSMRTRAALNRSISYGKMDACDRKREEQIFNDDLNTTERNIDK
jgi:hypothetical protein